MTSWLDLPKGGTLRLSRARVAAPLLENSVAAASPQDRDGFALVDVAVADGAIVRVAPAGPFDEHSVDLAGRHLWPGFVEIHTHFDKGHIWPRAANPDGSLPQAAATVAADRAAHWREADITARFDFGLRCAWAHGTTAIRTNIDSYVIAEARRGWAVFEEQRAAWAGAHGCCRA